MKRIQEWKARIEGFTLIELLVVVAIIALLISILLPSLNRARELSKRLVCSANLKGIGTGCKIYANEEEMRGYPAVWPAPSYDETAIDDEGIEYLDQLREKDNFKNYRLKRTEISYPDPAPGGEEPSTSMSVTRSFWILIRSSGTTTKQFICPSSDDSPDDTEEIARYYDFKGLTHISYGYQVPFGPRATRASEDTDTRMALAADASPDRVSALGNNPSAPAIGAQAMQDFTVETSPVRWRPFNSGNHGGRGAGEGQNVLFGDGHASWEQKPVIGVDNDNIYTLMTKNGFRDGRLAGEYPWEAQTNSDPYPGQDTFSSGGPNNNAITDSLIYP